MNEMTNANKKAWDRLAESHFKRYDIDRLLNGEPLLDPLIIKEVGDVKGKQLCHLLCHIGTDTLSWALLGAQVTGVDISPESLKYARLLADRMGIDARFVESDVMEAGKKLDEKFDVVFASTGVLCWIPDIKKLAAEVKGLLREGGSFYLYDGHPFRNLLLDEEGNFSDQVKGDYFRKEVWKYDEMWDYADPDLKVKTNTYEWDWTLGEVVSAFGEAGMRIEFLHEFPEYVYGGYTPFDVENHKVERYPCTFSLKAWR